MLFFNFFKKFDLVVLRLFNLHDRRLLHRDAAVLVAAELYDHHIVGDVDDYAVETAAGKHAVTNCHAGEQSCLFLLLLLLRADHQEIHNSKDNYHP